MDFEWKIKLSQNVSKGPVRFKKQALHLSDHRSPTGVLADKLVGQTETVKKRLPELFKLNNKEMGLK